MSTRFLKKPGCLHTSFGWYFSFGAIATHLEEAKRLDLLELLVQLQEPSVLPNCYFP